MGTITIYYNLLLSQLLLPDKSSLRRVIFHRDGTPAYTGHAGFPFHFISSKHDNDIIYKRSRTGQLRTNISQGSVALHSRCGEINDHFIPS